jgi:pyruvate kinase
LTYIRLVEGKPVIVATQMLESMQKNPRPTRAECTDVYNAIFDGADCVMLSGESAQGKYPAQSVAIMRRIVEQAEHWIASNSSDPTILSPKPSAIENDLTQTIAYSAVEASKHMHAACIIVLGKTGKYAAQIAKFRPNVPILVIVQNAKIARYLQLYRGIHPILMPSHDLTRSSTLSYYDRHDIAIQRAKDLGYCKSKDNVIIVSGDRGTNLVSNAATSRIVTVM